MLYESYIHPITILSTLPSAGVGALLALLICGNELTVVAIIGIVLLIGIVQKNAIMMIDFALEAQRKENKSAFDAIHEACLLRFRPILMTTMAALLGAVPQAFGQGVGSELRRPLGITIIGGLIFSQLLTLYTTPVIYLFFDGIATRLARWRDRDDPPANSPSEVRSRHEFLAGPSYSGRSPRRCSPRRWCWRGWRPSACCRCRRCRRWTFRRYRCRPRCPAPVRKSWPRRWRRPWSGNSARIASVTR